MEQLYVFGTGNAVVTHCYNTCFAIRNPEGEYFMADTGGGNGILRILEDMEVDMGRIHHIFLTHEHTDHLLGIIWLIRMISVRMKKETYKGYLYIYCHEDLAETVRIICRLTLQPKFYRAIGDTIQLVPVHDGESKTILNYPVTFFDIRSSKATQFGFTLTLENRKTLTCLGDEPCNPQCEIYAAGCDWLLHEAFCLYGDRDRFNPYEKHHSTVKDACQLAESLHIRNLVLWHTEDKTLATRKEQYTAEGARYFNGNLYVPYDGEILEL